MRSVRQIVYGVALCFLAALLAIEAKAAWAASANGSPSDISAVKLCLSAIKPIESRPAHTSPTASCLIEATSACAFFENVRLTKGKTFFTSVEQSSARPIKLVYFSPSRFLRPPPVL